MSVANILINPISSPQITGQYASGGSGGSGVTSVNSAIGAVSIVGTGTTSVSTVGSTITVNSTGGVASVVAGTGISIGGTLTTPVVNNTGVLSVTAGTNVTIGGTASNPVINATAGSSFPNILAGNNLVQVTGTAATPIISSFTGANTSDRAVFLGPFLTADSTINFGEFAGTTQAVSPSEYWFISGLGEVTSTNTNPAVAMTMYLDFVGTVVGWTIFSFSESNALSFGESFGFIVKVPSGVSSFSMRVGGSSGSGTITGSLQALTYTRLELT